MPTRSANAFCPPRGSLLRYSPSFTTNKIANAIAKCNSFCQFRKRYATPTLVRMGKIPEQDRRVAALRREVAAVGGAASFARLHKDVDPTYVSQLLTGHRSFGEKAARKMEQRCGWPADYLDDAALRARAAPAILTPEEIDLLLAWQRLTDKRRASLLKQIRAEAASNIEIAQHLKDLSDSAEPDESKPPKAPRRRPMRQSV